MASPVWPGMLTFYGNQPVIVQQVNARKGFSEKSAKTIAVLGALQLAAGFLAVVFQAAATGMETTSSRSIKGEFVSCGVWCGILLMVTGLLGILAGRKKTLNLTVAYLAFNVIVSVAVWTLVGFASGNLSNINTCLSLSKRVSSSQAYNESTYTGSDYTYRIIYSVYFYTAYSQDLYTCYGEVGRVWQAMDSLLLVIAIFEFATSLTSAAYCCRALSCCCHKSAQPIFLVQQSVSGPAGAYLCGPPNQPTILQQGSSVEFPMFTNPLMVTGEVGRRTEAPRAQMHLPIVQEAPPSSHASTSETSNYYTSPTESAPKEQLYNCLTPDEPPEYVEIVDTL